jgi:hypothetical protein
MVEDVAPESDISDLRRDANTGIDCRNVEKVAAGLTEINVIFGRPWPDLV